MNVIISNYRDFLDAKFERQSTIYVELQNRVLDDWFFNNKIEKIILVDYKAEGQCIFELKSFNGNQFFYDYTGTAS